jgi:hypothetical protein
MPDTKSFHGMKNILLDNDDWLVVDPLDYDAFVYYAPEKFKGSWNQFREGDTYFVIDKNNQSNNGLVTYTIHKEDGKIQYYNVYGDARPKMDVLVEFPDEVKSVVDDVIGVGEMYGLLTKIANGEEVSSRELENVDEVIWDFKFTPKAPFKSRITLRFDDEDYIRLFNPSDDDMWYYNAITNRYNTYEWEDDYHQTQDFKEGYFFNQFNEENLKKIRQIISIISPQSVELETDEQKAEAAEKLLDMFGNEIESIIYEYTSESNECKTRGFNQMIKDDFCNAFYSYGIITKYCLTEYFTSVSLLLNLYDEVGDKTLTISELLFRIGSDMGIAGWGEYIYELDCVDFNQESFDSECSGYLDKIIDKLEDESEYEDIYAYGDIYKRLDSKFKLNNRYHTKNGRDFFYRGVNPKNNRILIQVFKTDGSVGTEDRSYSEEEFNNFLVSPELFETKKRNVVLEQNTGNEVFTFISNLSKTPLMYLQNKLGEYKSKNPGVTLDMNTLVKQLSTPASPFKFTTFNIQTYEPKRISTLDVNLKNIGFTLTKSNIDPMSVQGGVKLKF